MKAKFRFKQKMLTLCCVPLVLLTVISVVIGLIQFKDGMYKETKNSLHSSAIAALNLYDSQGYGDYALKDDGNVWRGMNFDVSTETFIVDGLKEKTGVDITFFYKDTAVMTSITNEDNARWMGMQAGDNIKNYTLAQGAELWYKNIVIDDKMCHAYIIPITQSSDGSVIGAIMASQSADELNQVVNRYIFISVAVSLVILLAVIIFIFWYIGALTKVLHDVRRVLLKVSMGDLSDDRLIKTKRMDEFGELAQGTEKLRIKISELLSETQLGTVKLKEAVERLNVTSDQVISAAKETSSNVEKINTTANVQRDETKNATKDVEMSNQAINLMLDQIKDIDELSNEMERSAKESQRILEGLLESSKVSQETAKDISAQVAVTNESVQQIKSVTEYITDIAEETNLLALNASIEAARAGDAGKGFAVVAQQIQKLAEQSNNSAAQIGENIQELVNKTEGIVSAMAMIGDTLKAQETSVDQTKKIFDELSESIINVNRKESDMQKNVGDMTQAKENMSQLIAGLADSAEDSAAVSENAESMTEQMVAEMEGLASLTSDLTELANKLNENLEKFLA
ncbi:methyl-accepting chemotaxis protein [Roseburia sp. BX0805]|uniref:Methyl-accepting chemotaxis protein n=1 Tax=Roseburia yibonii TaxID=2763063 RepID=A0ABR7IBG7_9FIRM|nr:methyl-accepting chemotaxis protein [Roseburia yibonii]MBC5754291.1 methyl-accepting chemotaxis protein [Roseburia yibonii]